MEWQPLETVTPDFNLWLPFFGDAGTNTVFPGKQTRQKQILFFSCSLISGNHNGN
jgi:hypothetical protein